MLCRQYYHKALCVCAKIFYYAYIMFFFPCCFLFTHYVLIWFCFSNKIIWLDGQSVFFVLFLALKNLTLWMKKVGSLEESIIIYLASMRGISSVSLFSLCITNRDEEKNGELYLTLHYKNYHGEVCLQYTNRVGWEKPKIWSRHQQYLMN